MSGLIKLFSWEIPYKNEQFYSVSHAPGLFICLIDCYGICVLHDRCEACHNWTQNTHVNF